MDERWPHMVEFNGPTLQQRHQRLVLSLNPQIEKIDGNMKGMQTYLLNFTIIVKSFTRPNLLSRTKVSTQMCQSKSKGCIFFIYRNRTCSPWFPSQTWNIFPKNGLRFAFPFKNFSNLSFFSFHRGPHDASIEKTKIF
jgi:hypothetical protein